MEAHGRGEWQEDQQNQRGVKLPEAQMSRHQPPPPQRCPRCDSDSTKFCYFNNYSLSQPRYFCKACRSKAPSSSSSTGGERVRTQPLKPAFPPQNFTGMADGVSENSGTKSLRALPSMGPFYSGGEFLSMASMRSLNQQPRINQVPVNMGGGASMALMQGLNHPAGQVQPQNQTMASQQYVVPETPLSSWTPNYISNATGSASNPNFWSNANAGTTNNSGGMGSSINPNQWPDNLPGYNPSQ
ncbi:unnamed protein product [Fraxinus pennsylvanica]|uniref:Dof zinc finger protein n=1 Tax=Fraxinus pennsylvanica TaxID=56036 RepID=A0AAD1YSI3_9LAMI|nr:unnamed protein product [Fraxinus pennsylvanica]